MKSHCVMADLHIYVYMNLTKFVCSSMFGTVTSIKKKSDKYNLVINGQTVHIRTEISSMCYVQIYICMDGSPYCDDTVHILRSGTHTFIRILHEEKKVRRQPHCSVLLPHSSCSKSYFRAAN